MANVRYSVIYKYLFVAIVAFYALLLSRFGLENFDTGYIPSFSWRILNGQSVYQDFIYKGPPVTLYFHSIWMYLLPITGQFFWIRATNYLLFAIQVYLVISAVDALYDFSKFRTDKWGLMCVGFVVSLLNFSAYPWPTTDGIFFACIAFWVLSKTTKPVFFRLLIIAFFCVFSALTKQSFYLVPLFFLFWIFVRFQAKIALIFALQLVLWWVVYLGLILSITSWSNFIRQTTGETHLRDLLYVGFLNYIPMPIIWFVSVVGLAISILIYLKWNQKKLTLVPIIFKWMALGLFVIAVGFCFFKQVEVASRIAWVSCIFGLGYSFNFDFKNLNRAAPILVLLGISWSSAISLGYQYPIFFATGIIAAFVATMGETVQNYSKYFLWIALPVVLIAFSYNYRPYREKPITELNYPLDKISPKLKYIRTNKASYQKYAELKALIGRYGENFIVAPNIPMANYLFDQQSELPADWLIETEVARSQKMFISLAADKKNFIFLEKSFLTGEQFMPPNREKFSSIAEFIYQHFQCVGQTKHFLIYNALKKNETLP